MKSGFLFINKPVGPTSQQQLSAFKRQYRPDKIGHHGTLDPFASGMLLVGLGEATKFFQFIDDSQKTYLATLKLGEETDTLDHTGEVVKKSAIPDLSDNLVEQAMEKFIGPQKQVPPVFSAIKVNGEKLYEKARRGEEIKVDARDVEIHELKLIAFNQTEIIFQATVSRGTYIRSLARDLAVALKTCGHLSALSRTKLNGFMIDACWSDASGDPENFVIPIQDFLKHLPRIELDMVSAKKILNGRLQSLIHQDQPAVTCFCQGQFLGVGQIQGGTLSALRLMSDPLKNLS